MADEDSPAEDDDDDDGPVWDMELQTVADLPPRLRKLCNDMYMAWVMHHSPLASPPTKIGRFDGIRHTGRGGYGVVVLARDPKLDRRIAIKLCLSRETAAQDAFLREAKLLAMLAHPNVVRVFELGIWEGENFYAMEFIGNPDGPPCLTGHDYISYCGTWQQAVDFYLAAGEGLAAAHAQGIVHGDFKPLNILVDDRRPIIADFGLAQVVDQGLRHRLGTRVYMAPEVLRGEPGDARSDQWSFCVALWETMDRRLPFAGDSAKELLASIEGGPEAVEPPEVVPNELRTILRIGLSKDPEDRYPSMRALLYELRELRLPAKTPPHQSPGKKGRGIFIVSSVLALGIVLGATGVLFLDLPNAENHPIDQATESLNVVEPNDARDDEPSDEAAQRREVAAQNVLAQIAAHEFDQADADWQEEWLRRVNANEPRVLDALSVAEAFANEAESLAASEDVKGSTSAANKARAVALATQMALTPDKREAKALAATYDVAQLRAQAESIQNRAATIVHGSD